MEKPNWLEESFNESGTDVDSLLPTPQPQRLASSTSPEIESGIWHSWDMRVPTGRYRLQRVSTSASFFNYFVVGKVPTPRQLAPIQISDRLGELYPTRVTNASRDVVTREMIFEEMGNPSFIEFTVSSGVIFRIESFASKLPDLQNPPVSGPLPANFTDWVSFSYFKPKYDAIGDPIIPQGWVRTRSTSFGNTFPTVSKRSFGNGSLIYSAEDGGGADFNDLVVELSFLG